MQIEPFNPEDFDAVEKMVTAVWGDPVHRPEYDHAFCGHLTRYSYYDSELSFQIVDEEGIQGVCWVSIPGETNDADAWLEHTMNVLSERGFENLYLWTDSSCNWEFYLKHGFELVHEEKSDLYSTPEEDFKFMVFRKSLVDLPKLMRKQL